MQCHVQACHALPPVDNCNSTTVGHALRGVEAEIARKPICILVAAILPEHDVP